jgi:hypothetical protein
MQSRLLMLVALVIVLAGVWAALVTLFVPPLTLGWREFLDAMVRRWPRNIVVLGLAVVLILGLWLLFLAVSPWR